MTGGTPHPDRPPPSRATAAARSRAIVLLLLAAGLLVAAQWLRAHGELELDPESLRAWVDRQGWLAPVAFTLLVVFRSFLLLPSAVILAAGGLLFGVLAGSVLGAVGLVGSAAVTWLLARGLGGEVVRRRLADRFPRLDRFVGTSGPTVVGATVAYPAGAMTPVFWAAGFSSMRVGPLLGAVGAGGLVRSWFYSFFGASLLDPGSPAFWIAGGALATAIVLPLAHPRLRRRLFFRPEVPPRA